MLGVGRGAGWWGHHDPGSGKCLEPGGSIIPRHSKTPGMSKWFQVWSMVEISSMHVVGLFDRALGWLAAETEGLGMFSQEALQYHHFFSRHNIILYTHVYSCLIIILILRDSILYNIQTLSQNAECQDNAGACWWLSWSDYWTELPTTFSGSFGDRLITRHLKHSSQRIEKNQMDVLPGFVANCLTPPSHCVTIFYQLFFTNADGPYV